MAIAEMAIAAMAIAATAIARYIARCGLDVWKRPVHRLMKAVMQPESRPQPCRAGLLDEISRAVVRLHKEHIGQGPTKARTYICDDLVVCVLQGSFSTGERTLLKHGETAAVTSHRQALEAALRQPLIDTVEQLVGRKVMGLTSGVQPDAELSTEVFLLEPARPAHGGA
jgi:uncharacterized protein YbcI